MKCLQINFYCMNEIIKLGTWMITLSEKLFCAEIQFDRWTSVDKLAANCNYCSVDFQHPLCSHQQVLNILCMYLIIVCIIVFKHNNKMNNNAAFQVFTIGITLPSIRYDMSYWKDVVCCAVLAAYSAFCLLVLEPYCLSLRKLVKVKFYPEYWSMPTGWIIMAGKHINWI